MAAFKDRIKELRKELNLTQEELGNKIGKSESTISMYESGSREPKTSEDYVKLAELFDVTLDYLMGKSDYKKARILTIEELKTFLPEETVNNHKLDIAVDGKELSEEDKSEILKILKEKGFIK